MNTGIIFLLSMLPIAVIAVTLVSMFEKKIKKEEMEDDLYFHKMVKQDKNL